MSEIPSEDIGLVTSVSGNRITVEIPKGGGCKSCSMKGLCGSDNKPVVLYFDTDGQYQVGDKVNVSVSSGVRILSSVIVFVFPLLALFGFFLIGRSFMTELNSIIFGFGGLLLAFAVIKLLDKCIGKHINFQLGGKHEDMP
jgi:positive regulator of sigma E activity